MSSNKLIVELQRHPSLRPTPSCSPPAWPTGPFGAPVSRLPAPPSPPLQQAGWLERPPRGVRGTINAPQRVAVLQPSVRPPCLPTHPTHLTEAVARPRTAVPSPRPPGPPLPLTRKAGSAPPPQTEDAPDPQPRPLHPRPSHPGCPLPPASTNPPPRPSLTEDAPDQGAWQRRLRAPWPLRQAQQHGGVGVAAHGQRRALGGGGGGAGIGGCGGGRTKGTKGNGAQARGWGAHSLVGCTWQAVPMGRKGRYGFRSRISLGGPSQTWAACSLVGQGMRAA